MKIGDLVKLDHRALTAFPMLEDRVGIITDTLEDEYGYYYVEVDFVEERGWFETHELKKV